MKSKMRQWRPLYHLGIAATVFATGAMSASAAEYQPGEVLVKYKDGVTRTRETMNALYGAIGVQKVEHFRGAISALDRLVLKNGVKIEDAIARLSSNALVAYSQPNYILRTQPVDELKGDDSALYASNAVRTQAPPCWIPGIPLPPGCGRPDVAPAPAPVNPPVADPDLNQAYGLAKIQATEAWGHFHGMGKFIVADIDTGIDYNHEDLSFNVWRNPKPDAHDNDVVGYDFVHNDGLPFDDNEHGTHTAGTIGATGGNGVGISGVTQRVSLMAVKFLSGGGSGTTLNAIKGINYAVAHGAKVLSNSWGGAGDQNNQALSDAIAAAGKQDVLFVAAAGNSSADNDTTQTIPAGFPLDNIIAVAATDSDDNLANFSNYGATTVHVGAPGVDVYSTVPGNKYAKLSGTSMACPHVTGAAALIWSRNPKLHAGDIKKILMQTVDPLPSLQGKTISGGRINVLKALNAVEEGLRSTE